MTLSPLTMKMIRRLMHTGAEDKIAHAIEKIHPSEISLLFSELSPPETKQLINSLFLVAKLGETLRELPEFMVPDILEMIDDVKLAQMIARLESDDAIFLLEKIPSERWSNILMHVPTILREKIEHLLTYAPDTAGGIMSSDFMKVRVDMTLDEAIQSLRKTPDAFGIFYIYVVDEGNHLVGVQSLRDLVVRAPETKVRDVMNQEVYSVLVTTPKEEVAQKVAQYDYMAMPVVSENNELLGVITSDDVIDIIEKEATQDIYHLAGLSEVDRATTPLSLKVQKRLPWMILSVFTAGLAAMVVGMFQGVILEFVALAVFMPIVAAVGGNCGIQSLTVITRSIALDELSFIKVYKAILKEGASGLITGVACGLIIGLIGWYWKSNIYFGVTLFVTMIANLSIGALFGASLPILFKKLNLDPAVGTSVLVIMVTDTIGFGLFLGIASLFIKRMVL